MPLARIRPEKKTKSPEKEKGKKWDGTSRPSSELYKENWNEIFGQKEQEELKASFKQSLANKREREKKEEKQ